MQKADEHLAVIDYPICGEHYALRTSLSPSLSLSLEKVKNYREKVLYEINATLHLNLEKVIL